MRTCIFEPCSVKRGLNSLSNIKFLDSTKFRVLADNKSNITEMTISVFETCFLRGWTLSSAFALRQDTSEY